LRKKITSPGGTTAAGIAALEQFDVKQAFTTCIAQAETKSRELAKSATQL
jgi:pyrroline-5-carboxylate reductase